MKFRKILPLFIFLFSIAVSEQPAQLGKLLYKKYLQMNSRDQAVVLIYFKDKGTSRHLREINASSLLSERSIERRIKTRDISNILDEQDLPLEPAYIQSVEQNVIHVRHELKWFNAVSAVATKQQIDALRNLPFVKEIELVGRWTKRAGDEEESNKVTGASRTTSGTNSLDYGTSFTQVNQIKVPPVHDLGIYGQGVVVGVFDNGFRLLTHEAFASMHIIAQQDFVDHKESVVPNNPNTGFGSHGVNTLSTIGGYKPGQLIGPAFRADFILARTENDSSETPIEEDNWAKAIEWADSIGVDVTSTSLGYLTYDPPYTSWTWADMNGNTTLITKAADRAVGLGIVVVNSAGNSGAGDGIHNTLGAPSDGDSVIAAGAVTSAGVRTSFSSVGPTADGRTKPDIMAMGSGVKVASSTNTSGYGSSSGTSFSCPLSAGVAALIRCANPALTAMQVRDAMRNTASQASSPDNLMGWGILDADSAIKYFGILPMGRISGLLFNDLNGNGVKDSGEPPVTGNKIYISGTKTDSTITDLSGNYFFGNLAIGNYSIAQRIPAGWTRTFPASNYSINLLHRIDTIGINFGMVYVPDTGTLMGSGWQLLSLPYRVVDNSENSIYPDAGSGVFTYSAGYQLQDTVPSRQGFWVKFNSPRLLLIQGMPRLFDTINVYAGWNIIGGLSVPVPTNSIIQEPINNVTTQYFKYTGTYTFSDTLFPYFGYWVKANQNGRLILNGVPR